MTFKPGQSGNLAGRPKGKSLRQLLQALSNKTKYEIVLAMVDKAKHGDVRASEWIAKWGSEPTVAGLEIATREFSIRIGVPNQEDETEDEQEGL